MFAVIQTGGKQYKVCVGDEILVEKLDGQVGDQVTYDALMIEKDGVTTIGTPVVEGVKVNAEIVEHGKAKKIVVFTYIAKKRHKNKYGHRQPFTKIKVTQIG
jgi:large subunit ribosomal protein L21